jgi:hypothetical protein
MYVVYMIHTQLWYCLILIVSRWKKKFADLIPSFTPYMNDITATTDGHWTADGSWVGADGSTWAPDASWNTDGSWPVDGKEVGK